MSGTRLNLLVQPFILLVNWGTEMNLKKPPTFLEQLIPSRINRKPGEQIEVDWAGDPAQITDPDTGEIIPAFLFVGVMTYSQYPYVEAFIDEKQRAWITAHVHMYEYFGGVTRILVPDNTKTAVIHNNDWYNQELNTIYHEMAEH